jgi:hypothetical protein
MDKPTSLIKHVGNTKEGYNILQVPLFMTANDIVKDHPLGLADAMGDQSEKNRSALMDKKYGEASQPAGARDGQYAVHGAGLRDSIHAEGFDPRRPIEISPPLHSTYYDSKAGEPKPFFREADVTEGHHRLSVMFKDFPEHPVPHTFGKRVVNENLERIMAKAHAANKNRPPQPSTGV